MGKEDKQAKQHYYVTSSNYTDEGLQYDNIAKHCHVKLNGESVNLHGQNVTKFLTNSCMFAYE